MISKYTSHYVLYIYVSSSYRLGAYFIIVLHYSPGKKKYIYCFLTWKSSRFQKNRIFFLLFSEQLINMFQKPFFFLNIYYNYSFKCSKISALYLLALPINLCTKKILHLCTFLQRSGIILKGGPVAQNYSNLVWALKIFRQIVAQLTTKI